MGSNFCCFDVSQSTLLIVTLWDVFGQHPQDFCCWLVGWEENNQAHFLRMAILRCTSYLSSPTSISPPVVSNVLWWELAVSDIRFLQML